MVSEARWQPAQQYERGYWESLGTHVAAGSVSQLHWCRWMADQLVLRLRALDLRHLTEGGARREDLAGPERRANLKGLLGVSEFRVSVVGAQPSPTA